MDCHGADKTDADAWDHYGETIATIVTPLDCATCHDEEASQFQASHHAKGGEILGSLDNVLGEVVEGVPAAVNGCKQCHGSFLKLAVGADGKVMRGELGQPLYDPKTWPNTGIGRVNLDGSKGSCSACHSRHTFSTKVARNPENCGKCHMGPDHPQIEIYEESKHGIAFRAFTDQMHMDSDSWVVGKDYFVAPTCATCHMSATKTQPITHDPGDRISWTLRPAVSRKLENWEQKRKNMQNVCSNYHSGQFVTEFYKQYDEAVNLYNEKFAKPGAVLMAEFAKRGKLTENAFDEKLEWQWWELWHHEGRRARMGASMMGPDYTQWHGFYDVAKNFYTEFLPEAKQVAEGDEVLTKMIDDMVKTDWHGWLQGQSKEERDRIRQFYEDRYGKGGGP